MVNEAKLTEHYSIIANKLKEMIPCEWDNLYMYGEVLDDSREVYFYFKPAGEDEFVYKMNDEECQKATIADGRLKAYNDSHNSPLYKGVVGRKRVAPEAIHGMFWRLIWRRKS